MATDYSADASCAGYWRMIGASTAGETDYSGNDNTLTKSANTVTGKQKNLFSFLGFCRKFAGGWLTRADGGSLNISGVGATITLHAKINKNQYSVATNSTHNVLGKYDYGTNNRQYVLNVIGVTSTTIKFVGIVSANGTTAVSVFSTLTNYSINTQYDVTFVADGTDLRLYVNGELACTPVAHTTGIFNGTSVFGVGVRGTLDGSFEGLISEPAVFSRALSASEVYEMYEYGVEGTRGGGFLDYTDIYSTDGLTLSYANLNTAVDALVAANADYTSVNLGVCADGTNQIRAVVVEPASYSKTIMVQSCIHGDEQPPARGALDLLGYLNENPDKYADIRWVIIPVFSPSGYLYGGGTASRRNNNIAENRRVDLNRNFAPGWATSTGSTDPTNDYYKGPFAESEPEVAVLKTAFATYEPDIFIDNHSDNDWVTIHTGQDGTMIAAVNDHIAAAGYEEYPINVHDDNGEAVNEAYDIGIDSYVFEWGAADAPKEVNRFLSSVIFMSEFDSSPSSDTAAALLMGM